MEEKERREGKEGGGKRGEKGRGERAFKYLNMIHNSEWQSCLCSECSNYMQQ